MMMNRGQRSSIIATIFMFITPDLLGWGQGYYHNTLVCMPKSPSPLTNFWMPYFVNGEMGCCDGTLWYWHHINAVNMCSQLLDKGIDVHSQKQGHPGNFCKYFYLFFNQLEGAAFIRERRLFEGSVYYLGAEG